MDTDGRCQWVAPLERTFVVKQTSSSRFPNLPRPTHSPADRPFLFTNLFKRELDTDVVIRGDKWPKESGVQRQLEFEGYTLRWVNTDRLDVNLAEGWQYVTVSYYLW